MTTYRGYNVNKLNKIVDNVKAHGDGEITLKNGETVSIYGGNDDSWLVVDAEDREHDCSIGWEMAILLMKLAEI